MVILLSHCLLDNHLEMAFWFRQTGKLPPAHFYLGWRRTDVERCPTAVRRRSVVVLRIVSGAEKKAFDRGGPIWPPRSNAKDASSGFRGEGGRGSGGAVREGLESPESLLLPESWPNEAASIKCFFFGAADDMGAADDRPPAVQRPSAGRPTTVHGNAGSEI